MYRSSYYESDQKDIIIAQLKADIFEASKQQEESDMLQEDLNKWEIKLKMAAEEKLFIEHEHKQRHEQALSQIQSMNQEIKQLSNILKERHLDQERQLIQEKELQEINEQRQIEIQQARKTLDILSDQIHLESESIETIQNELEHFESQCKQAEKKNSLIKNNLISLTNKNKQLEEICQKLQQQLLSLQQSDQEQEIIKLQKELSKNNDQINYLETQQQQIKYSHKQIDLEIQKKSYSLSQYENDISKQKKQLIIEGQKRDELLKKKNQFQKQIIISQDQHKIAFEQFDKSKQENENIFNQNSQFKDNLKLLQNHIEVLLKVNQELVDELELYCGDDKKVKEILNRAMRVKELQMRTVSGNRLIKK